MSRTKTKRIVWTMAVLLALSFVAAMVLHKHEEPIIIGNLSKEDASEISKVTLKFERDKIKEALRGEMRNREIKTLMEQAKYCLFGNVQSIEVIASGEVAVITGIGTNEDIDSYYVQKGAAGWNVMPWATDSQRARYDHSTNTAPVPQRGVGK